METTPNRIYLIKHNDDSYEARFFAPSVQEIAKTRRIIAKVLTDYKELDYLMTCPLEELNVYIKSNLGLHELSNWKDAWISFDDIYNQIYDLLENSDEYRKQVIEKFILKEVSQNKSKRLREVK